MAFTIRPRQAVIAQTPTGTARVSGLSPSSNAWKSCCAWLPILGRFRRLPSEPWTAFDKDRPSIGRALKFTALTPQDCTPTTCSLAPDAPANRQATCPESGSLSVCFPALQIQRRPPPLSECRFFAPSVRVRLSSMPVNPDATHSHHPRYPSLAPVRGHCGLSAAAVEDAGVIRQPAIAAADALAQPQEGHAQANAAGVRPHPSPPKTASPGSGQGCPAFRPVSRFSPVAAETSLRKCRPKSRLQRACCSASPSRKPGCRRRVRYANTLFDPPAADRRHPVTTFPHAVFASLTCLHSRPPARLFHLRRRAGPRSLRKLVCAGVAATRLRGRTLRVLTIQPTTPIYPKTDKEPQPRRPDPDPDAAPTTPLCA